MTTSASKEVPAVALYGLGRRYGRQFVLNNVSLVITSGKCVLLVGGNGAGKTTLLKVLATRLRPSRGEGQVFGASLLTEAHEVRKNVAYLSVAGGHYPSLTALENLSLAAALHKHRQAVTKAELEGKLEAVGLLDAKDKLVRYFSSGMKKRLGLARLLLTDADLWLLDEPYTALDEDGKQLVDTLLDTARSQGRTVVMASHEVSRASQFADSILEVRNGQLQQAPTLVHEPAETIGHHG